MEEQAQKECKTKKCCGKCIIIVILCSLVCFIAGYYAGSKSLAKVSSSAIDKPFSSSSIPKIPNPGQMNAVRNVLNTSIQNAQKPSVPNIPNVNAPNVQKPPVTNVPNVQTPSIQASKVNLPDSVKEKAQANKNTEQEK